DPPIDHRNQSPCPTSDHATVAKPKMPPPIHVLITSATMLQRPMARTSPWDSSWLGCVETPVLIRDASARENLRLQVDGIVSQNDGPDPGDRANLLSLLLSLLRLVDS